jgi:Fe/S biogenesis protein NfuA
VTAPASGGGAARFSDDELYERVSDLFEQQVNPMVARHGGRVELIDVQDAVVMLRMGGGCQGCGMASVTLRQGIEGLASIPEVQGSTSPTVRRQSVLRIRQEVVCPVSFCCS